MHSPGPWTLEYVARNGGYHRLEDDAGKLVAELWGCRDDNYNALRAAPELIEAIADALVDVGGDSNAAFWGIMNGARDDEALTISAGSVKALAAALVRARNGAPT